LSWQDPDARPQPGGHKLFKALMRSVLGRIHGELHYLWSAVDQDGHVLEILVQSRRIAKAAICTLLVPAPPA
jgi:putative transposase